MIAVDGDRIAELEQRLAEAEETIEAIRSGEVDALVVGDDAERRVFTLESADRPYRLLIEQMREGAVTLGPDGLILYANGAFAELVGEPGPRVVGTRLGRFTPGAQDQLARLLAAGGRCELALAGADGALRPVRLSLSPLPVEPGDDPILCGVVTDLSEARDLADARQALAVEEARQEGEESYRALFNSIDAGFCIVEVALDEDGRGVDHRFLETNPAFARQTGIHDAAGRWVSEIAPRVGQHWNDIYARVAMTGVPERIEQQAMLSEERWIEAYVYRVGPDTTRHVAVLFTDVSERRRADLLLKQMNQTLERRVGERTAELAAANDRLQVEMAERARTEEALRHAQKVEAIGHLTGGVAHDFNNLLTIIRSSVDLLRRRELPEDRRRRYIDAISDTADRAAKLTSQLLAYARKQPLRPEIFDAAALLRTATDMVHTTVGERIDVRVDLRCETCFVEADANQFETALLNMAVNARDAMNGEGRLTITVEDDHALPGGRFVAITVADTGAGIPAERLQRIFEPFYTTKGVGKGTGLGLSQVYGFAKQSGGEVRVTSELGQGTSFTLYLPQVAQGAPAPAGPAAEGHGAATGRLLLVEDNPEVGDVAVQLLEELGYTVVRAADAASALAIVEGDATGFDLVFSDVVMPGEMSGVDLARTLRRTRPALPVVLTTGYSETLADGGVEGVEVLRKPYSVEALARIIRRALRAA